MLLLLLDFFAKNILFDACRNLAVTVNPPATFQTVGWLQNRGLFQIVTVRFFIEIARGLNSWRPQWFFSTDIDGWKLCFLLKLLTFTLPYELAIKLVMLTNVKVLRLDYLATWKFSGIKQHLGQQKHITNLMFEKRPTNDLTNCSLPSFCWLNLMGNNHQTTNQNKVHWHPPQKKSLPPKKKLSTSPFLDVSS